MWEYKSKSRNSNVTHKTFDFAFAVCLLHNTCCHLVAGLFGGCSAGWRCSMTGLFGDWASLLTGLFADWVSLHRPNWHPLLLGAILDC